MTATPRPPTEIPAAADVVIVGGGLAGLTAAAITARDGLSVAVLERKSCLGGRARSERRDGFTFNQGAHALYCAGEGMRTLARLGITPTGARPPLGGMGRRDGRLGTLPAGPGSLLTSALLSPRGKAAMASAFARLQMTDPDRIGDVPLADWIDRHTSNPDVRQILHALGRLATYADAPETLSAGAVVAQLRAALKGVLYVDSGWTQLVDALSTAATAAGARIIGGATVDAIGPAGRSLAVQVGDQECRADAVVVAGLSPAQTADVLGLDRAVFGHAGPAVEAAVLDLSLDDEPDHRFVLGIDEPTYFSVHSPPAAMAPEGCAAAVGIKYLDPSVETTAEADRAELHAVAGAAGVESPRDTRFLRRMTVASGIPLAARGGLSGRPDVAVPDMPGVSIAGDWIGPTGMLADAAFASAAAAAQAAATHATAMSA